MRELLFSTDLHDFDFLFIFSLMLTLKAYLYMKASILIMSIRGFSMRTRGPPGSKNFACPPPPTTDIPAF